MKTLLWLALGVGLVVTMLKAKVHPLLVLICVTYAALFAVAYHNIAERSSDG